jgi:cytochrome o ubiquinol oxidase subunit 1
MVVPFVQLEGAPSARFCDQPIPLVAGCLAFGIVGCLVVYVALKGWIPYLWREWITSVDHKHIGVMYIFLAMVMLLRGFTDAIMMRSQQALAYNAPGYLPPEHYDQIFSAHGTLMILFVAMPFMIGLINIVVPLQLGVRDVAFPTLNSVSFWLTATGALLINLSLVIGEFARTGWLPYPPLSELAYSPGVGVDYYLWSLQFRRRYIADRSQLRHHDSEDSRSRHDLHAHADLLLDGTRLQPLDRRRFSRLYSDVGDAAP